ncbi:methionine ABC transporter permease [Pseudoflavonifractor phocaeensis]|uniref:methionine ABC transporter permease n=1 Tax=Pseudoflavonifractor phocaeensis TaxID=1870988 RepID=UPI003090C618|nr:putative D-methionine transport system permease protein MetI [Oscillospiraceae bacterium]
MAELLYSIIPNVVDRSDQLWQAFVQTIQMVGISGAISLLFGIPLGVLLFTTRTGGILQNRPLHFLLSKFCDVFRSIPFILLAILLLGLSRLIMHTAIGVRGAIIPLLFGTVPYLARQVEGALAEVPDGLIEAAQSMGCSPWEIVTRVYLKEGIPGIARGVTITLISLINFTAIAGTIGAGGLGNFALMYGHSKNLPDITVVVILIIIVLVSLVQAAGNYVVNRSTH